METKISPRLKIFDKAISELAFYIPVIHTILPYLRWKFDKDYIQKRINKAEGGGLRVLEIEGELAGLLAWLKQEQEKVYLWAGGVLPRFRDRGLMTLLLDTLLEDLKQRGYKEFSTKTKEDNNIMLTILLKRGFKVVSLKKDEKGLKFLQLVLKE